MGPAGKFLNIRQGERSIEDYARDFVGGARRSATEKTCLMVFFWGGLAEPFKSLMPYWHPEESLEEYINRALYLRGSSFRVELAAEPAHSSLGAAIQETSEVMSAVPRTSCPFLGHPGLIRSVQDPPLRSVSVVLSTHVPSKAAVPAHVPPEAAVPTHVPPEAAVPAHDPPEAAVPAHGSPEAAVPAHDPPEAAVPAHVKAPEAAVPAHVPLEVAVPAHGSPEAAVPAHDPPEVAVPAHVPPEAAVPAHGSPEAAVPAHVPPEAAVPAHVKTPEAAVPAHGSPEAAVPAHVPPEAAVPAHVKTPEVEVPAHVSPEVEVLVAVLPEAVDPAEGSSEAAVPARVPPESAAPALELCPVPLWSSARVPEPPDPPWLNPPHPSWPPALPVPSWHPGQLLSPGLLPLHGPGPPSHPLINLLSTSLLNLWVFWWNVWKPFLREGVLSGVRALCFSLSPPEVTIAHPPGLLYLNSTHLCTYSLTHSCCPS